MELEFGVILGSVASDVSVSLTTGVEARIFITSSHDSKTK